MGRELDPFSRLRSSTRARIGLARAGGAMAHADVLAFQLACAQARDAVRAPLDFESLSRALAPRPLIRVKSLAPDREVYLRRPDLGRRLDPAAHALLPKGDYDLAVVLGDGLSALALQRHGPGLVGELLDRLGDLRIAPLVFVEQARVAVGDDVGEALGAKLTAVILGERPGLSSADSLGVYLTYGPRPGRMDSERNCVSNIHDQGLSYADAAQTLSWLSREALRRGLTGVQLKDDPERAIAAHPAVMLASEPAPP